MTDPAYEELHRRAADRAFRATEERSFAAAELSILVEEAQNYDTLLERAAPVIARHGDGGCVIALLYDDDETLHPLGVHHPDPEATEALEHLVGLSFQPMGVSHAAMRDAQAPFVTLDAAMFDERPGVARYMEITGHRHAIVVPMRALGRSRGVIWFAAGRPLERDDANFITACASRLALAVELLRYREGDVHPKPRVTNGPLSELTSREREILALIAAGLTSREAAERLVVSIRTVEWHRARVQAKLGVSGRSELTRIARESGLDIPVR